MSGENTPAARWATTSLDCPTIGKDGWRDCAIRTSAARSLCCTRPPRRHWAQRRLPPRWACRDRASLSDSRHWSTCPSIPRVLAHAARGATATWIARHDRAGGFQRGLRIRSRVQSRVQAV